MAGLDDLSAITDVLYQIDLARFQAISAEESALLRAIEELNEEEQRAEAISVDGAVALQLFGGDLLWKAWVGRKRQVFNQNLTDLKIRKEVALQALQKSFGKKTVSQELDSRARQDQHRERALRCLAEEQEQLVLKAGSSGFSQD